jgi:hypothetical protein
MTARRSTRIRPALLAGLALLAGAVHWAACGDDDDSGLPVDRTIRITETNFIPNEVTVVSGSRIEWQNRFREDRTVTSGTGAADPAAGDLFDVTLRGYRSGEAIGGTWQQVFTATDTLHPDTIHYFSRLVPDGFTSPFRGRVIVTPF